MIESPSDSPDDIYQKLHAADREWLMRTAANLRADLRRSATDVIRLGRILTLARKRLGRGAWAKWLASEACMPRRSASRMIAVYRSCGTVESKNLEKITPSALYAMAETGVPQSLREYAIEQAKEGVSVSLSVWEEWVKVYRSPVAQPSLSLAPLDSVETAKGCDTYWHSDNWQRLMSLLETPDTSLYICALADVENGDRLFSATLIGPDRSRRQSVAPDLERIVLRLTGGVREKLCRKCQSKKPIDRFSHSKSQPDGRNRYCLSCERTRVKDYSRRKSEDRKLA